MQEEPRNSSFLQPFFHAEWIDVYKRQVYYHAMNTPEAVKMVLDTIASPNLRVICDLANYVGPENASVDTPVSYTHLDVYKRQPLLGELSAKQTERLITAASVSKLRVGSPQLRRCGFTPVSYTHLGLELLVETAGVGFDAACAQGLHPAHPLLEEAQAALHVGLMKNFTFPMRKSAG